MQGVSRTAVLIGLWGWRIMLFGEILMETWNSGHGSNDGPNESVDNNTTRTPKPNP